MCNALKYQSNAYLYLKNFHTDNSEKSLVSDEQ